MSVLRTVRQRLLISKGATVALTGLVLAATSLVASTSAAPNTSPAVLTPITPCRLMDTRSTSQVGPKGNPLTAGVSYTSVGRGSVGLCNIPVTATALLVNVTAVNGSAKSYLTLYPDDVSRPTASNLNWVAGQGATPNSATIALGATGQFSIYNDAGTVNVIIDVAGYYQTDAAVGGPRAYGLVSFPAGATLAQAKNATGVTSLATGLVCIELASSIDAHTAVLTVTMDYSRDGTNTNNITFAENSGFCGINGISVVMYRYQLGTAAQNPNNEAFYFTVG